MIAVPFNFQPTSVTTRTGSYTIPAGSYAYVVAHVGWGGTFTIDGNTALGSGELQSTPVDVTSSIPSATLTSCAADEIFEGQIYFGGTNTITVGGVTAASGVAGDVFPIRAGGNQTIAVGGSAASVSLSGYRKKVFQIDQMMTQGFWVPTGTILNETGTSYYTVSLFNEIS